ncbi:hypothetical protein E2C01_096843 [Portunus trituberculatus]|uniref:Uncharacterized protein n=1 Tax=Portunus trituberculatus TaxID=210409 RepID=A0A5B7JYW1_PORTR|nr:hypothetical protein [Portunus trituberculatus]
MASAPRGGVCLCEGRRGTAGMPRMTPCNLVPPQKCNLGTSCCTILKALASVSRLRLANVPRIRSQDIIWLGTFLEFEIGWCPDRTLTSHHEPQIHKLR